MATVSYSLPYPPSINNYYKRTGAGMNCLPKIVKKFRSNVEAAVLQQGQPPRLEGEISLCILVYPPDTKRKRDLDNIVKPLQDALQYAGVMMDDTQVGELRVFRMEAEGPGKVTVIVTPRIEEDLRARCARKVNDILSICNQYGHPGTNLETHRALARIRELISNI